MSGLLSLASCNKGTKTTSANSPAAGSERSEISHNTGREEAGENVGGAEEPAFSSAGQAQGQHDLVAAPKLFQVELINADVTVAPVAAGQQAGFKWEIVADAAAKSLGPESLNIELAMENGGPKLTGKFSGTREDIPPLVKLTVALPESCDMVVRVGNGRLDLEPHANVAADLGNGDLQIRGEPGNSNVTVGNGSLKAELLLPAGVHDYRVSGGDMHFKLLEGSDVTYTAATGSGNVKLTGLSSEVRNTYTAADTRGMVAEGKGKLVLQVGMGQIFMDGPEAVGEQTKTPVVGGADGKVMP
jgi:hypothetical protein